MQYQLASLNPTEARGHCSEKERDNSEKDWYLNGRVVCSELVELV